MFSFICIAVYLTTGRLVGRVVKASASRAAVAGLIPAFTVDLFLGPVIQGTLKLVLPEPGGPVIQGTLKLVLPEPGGLESALRLVSPVSVYRDWARKQVSSTASISVWQHVQ